MAKELVDTTAEIVEETEAVPVSALITVKQLPIIEEHLERMRQEITAITEEALALPVTDETVKEIKKKRSALNKQFKELDAKRKEVKKKVTEPYDNFEKSFKTCITDLFKKADEQLAAKIAEVENARKAEKEENVRSYFTEYAASLNLPDFITYERMGLEIIFSTSLKRYKEQVKAFLDRAASDLQLIETQEHSEEILVEYKQSLDASRAILIVNNRHKMIEAERQRAEEMRQRREKEAAMVAKVEAVREEEIAMQAPEEAPVESPAESPVNGTVVEQIYEGTFTLIGTKKQIKNIIEYIKEKGVEIQYHGKFTKITTSSEA